MDFLWQCSRARFINLSYFPPSVCGILTLPGECVFPRANSTHKQVHMKNQARFAWSVVAALGVLPAWGAKPPAKSPVKLKAVASASSVNRRMKEQLRQVRQAIARLRRDEAKLQQLQASLRAALAAAPAPVAAAPPAAAPAPAPAQVPPAAAAAPARAGAGAGQDPMQAEAPLQFKIGQAYVTPVGFMDFAAVYRSVNVGSGIGTNFAGIPYGTASNYHTQESEFRQSMQNSRLGLRIDASVAGGHVIGYWESDFLGAAPSNLAVSSNSNTFRSRLFWVDYRKGAWEFLGGQTWSLATPNRSGISPLPGDVFFSDDFDTNYQVGNVWGRIPEFRVVYHFPQDKAAFALAVASPDQYMGGTNGSAAIKLPACCAYYANGEIDAGAGNLGPANRGPDIIAKFAVDPSKRFHGEIGGIARFFQAYNQATQTHFSSTGGAGFLNLGFNLTPGLHLLSNNYWSDGGGRYLFGQAPDLVVRADGSLGLVHSGSTVDGFEFTSGHNTIAAYYSVAYIARNVAYDTNGCPIGWGYGPFTTPGGKACAGSSDGQNRSIQEASLDYIHTFWANPRYGALTMFLQYSYLTRNPWYVAAGQPKNAHASMGWFDLRYTLPGSAPTLGKH